MLKLFPFSAQIESNFDANLARNPANKNSGKFVTLPEFLELAKTKAVHGILISIKVSSSWPMIKSFSYLAHSV